MDRLAIEFISVLGMPPPAFVAEVRGLGVAQIGIALTPISTLPGAYPAWSLRDDADLRRETIAALRANDVAISLAEGFLVLPDREVDAYAQDLDLVRELGAPRVNILAFDPDLPRSLDQLARFAELAGERGMAATLEFLPMGPIASLDAAVAAAAHVGRASFGMLADMMHVARSGGTAESLAAVAPGVIAYAQLCDVPLVSRYDSYAEEARLHRLPLGEGELPLAALVAALPDDIVVGLEIPRADAATRGIGARERLAGSVAVARRLLS